MNLVIYTSIFINLFTLILFIIGFHFIPKQNISPKFKEFFPVFMAISLILYFLSIVTVVISEFSANKSVLLLLAFIAFPFIIGHYVTYKTVKTYSAIQLFALFAGLISLFMFI